jgi:hypothetical protein
VAEFEALMAAMQVVCASTIYGFVTWKNPKKAWHGLRIRNSVVVKYR